MGFVDLLACRAHQTLHAVIASGEQNGAENVDDQVDDGVSGLDGFSVALREESEPTISFDRRSYCT